MDQTTLNQFFVTRKSSFNSSLPPAKRVKLDSTTKLEKKEPKKRTTVVKDATNSKTASAKDATKSKTASAKDATKSKRTTQRKVCKKPDEKIFNLFNAKPVEGKAKPVGRMTINREGRISGNVKNNDDGDIDDVFTAVKSKRGEVVGVKEESNVVDNDASVGARVPTTPKKTSRIEATTPKKTPLVEAIPKCNQLSVNDDINDQAKTILYSRGSVILKAGYDRQNQIQSPSKASEVLNLLSPRKSYASRTLEIIGSPSKSQLKSPLKLSEVLNTLSPRKLTMDDIQQKIKSPPKIGGSLNLANAKESTTTNSSTVASSGRDRLRNKFKHLISDGEIKNGSKDIQKSGASHDQGGQINTEKASERLKHLTQKTSEKMPQVPEEQLVKNEKASEKFKHLTQKTSSESSTLTHGEPLVKEKASERFKHLTQKATSSGFVLPPTFKNLVEMFRCVDSILFLLRQRSEVCTFDKLKRSVQEMSSRNFDQDHLAAMKTVYPNAFVFRQEKGFCSLKDVSKASHQLTIEANFKEHLASNSSKVTSHILVTRRLQLEKKLVDIVKVHHQKFLRKLNMKISDSEIHRWHPNFNLNNVPDIELSALPQPPIVKSFSSAHDLMANNRGKFAPKVENALLNVANKLCEQEPNDNTSNNTNHPEQKINTNNKLKGVSSSLLERIRQKEQMKNQLAMTRDPAKEEKLAKMQRLPEMCRILKAYFTAEKKVAITLEDCVQKMSESYGTSVSLQTVEEHVVLLSELVPNWLTIAKVRKFPFVKLAKGYDINKVINTLNDIQTKESET